VSPALYDHCESQADKPKCLVAAKLYRNMDQKDKAEEVYRKLIEMNPDNLGYYRELLSLKGYNIGKYYPGCWYTDD
jgi:tetratricopeptide (TPR) repeat protein